MQKLVITQEHQSLEGGSRMVYVRLGEQYDRGKKRAHLMGHVHDADQHKIIERNARASQTENDIDKG